MECAGFPLEANPHGRRQRFRKRRRAAALQRMPSVFRIDLFLLLFLASGGSRRTRAKHGAGQALGCLVAVLGPALHSFSEGGTARPTWLKTLPLRPLHLCISASLREVFHSPSAFIRLRRRLRLTGRRPALRSLGDVGSRPSTSAFIGVHRRLHSWLPPIPCPQAGCFFSQKTVTS